MQKTTKLALIVSVLLLAAIAAVWLIMTPGINPGEKTVEVRVTHLDGSEKSISVKSDGETVRQVLEPEGIISGEDRGYGLWIQTVDGETADESLEQWWGYDINGEMAMYGADEQTVKDGDIIEFTLYEGY